MRVFRLFIYASGVLMSGMALQAAPATDPATAATQPVPIEQIIDLPAFSLKSNGKTAREAFEMLGRAAEATVSPVASINSSGGVPTRRYDVWKSRSYPDIDFDLESVSFWQGFDRLRIRTGLTLGATEDDWLRLRPDDDTLLKPVAITHHPLAQTAVLGFSNSSRLMLELRLDPRIKLVGAADAVVEYAYDRQNRRIWAQQSSSGRIADGGLWSFIQFSTDASSTTDIGRLRGYFPVDVAVRSQRVELPLILGAKREADGLEIEIAALRYQPPRTANGFAVTAETSATLRFKRSRQSTQALPEDMTGIVRWVDIVGLPLASHPPRDRTPEKESVIRQTFGCAWIRRDGVGAEPMKLMLNIPLEIKTVAVPFEFRDLQLPR